MIKIQIPDVETLKAEYLKLVKHLVIEDLKSLQISLEHLNDSSSIKVDDILSAKIITKEIANIIRSPKLPNKNFNKSVYSKGVKEYLNGATKINTVNLAGLLKLVGSLLDTDNGQIASLLVGEPQNLKKTSEDLLKAYNIEKKEERDIVKLGFKYTGDPGAVVRGFFYEKSLTTFCPYCNQGLALHSKNAETGKTADQFHLDHFFDKDNYPLLALSLFNLVPCDSTCNVSNKHTTPFTDEFHLNPYISGFKRDMVFKPLYNPLDQNITEIELAITVPRVSPRHLQLIGDVDKLNEKPEHGNLNVFEIYTKYNRVNVREQSTHIFRKIYKAAINKKSLTEFLEEMGLENTLDNFKNWYEETVHTRFYEKEFDKHAYSKLNRDIFDFVYTTDAHDSNDKVREMIIESYLPGKGGE